MKTTIIFAILVLSLTGCATQSNTAEVKLNFIPKNNNIAQFNADVNQCRIETSKRFGDMLAGAPDSAMMMDCLTVQMGHKIVKQ